MFQRLCTLARHRSTLLQGGNADASAGALGALVSSMGQALEHQGVVEALMESRFLRWAAS